MAANRAAKTLSGVGLATAAQGGTPPAKQKALHAAPGMARGPGSGANRHLVMVEQRCRTNLPDQEGVGDIEREYRDGSGAGRSSAGACDLRRIAASPCNCQQDRGSFDQSYRFELSCQGVD